MDYYRSGTTYIINLIKLSHYQNNAYCLEDKEYYLFLILYMYVYIELSIYYIIPMYYQKGLPRQLVIKGKI